MSRTPHRQGINWTSERRHGTVCTLLSRSLCYFRTATRISYAPPLTLTTVTALSPYPDCCLWRTRRGRHRSVLSYIKQSIRRSKYSPRRDVCRANLKDWPQSAKKPHTPSQAWYSFICFARPGKLRRHRGTEFEGHPTKLRVHPRAGISEFPVLGMAKLAPYSLMRGLTVLAWRLANSQHQHVRLSVSVPGQIQLKQQNRGMGQEP